METQALQAVQYRLTQHYIDKLRQANLALEHTRENSNYWFRLIEQDWAQIKNWQNWASVHSADDLQCAQFCATFGAEGHEYVSVRQSPAERLIWYRQALVAAQQIGDHRKERMLLYNVGSTSYQVGGLEEAEQCAKRLLKMGRSPIDHLSLGDGWFIIGNIHSHRTELDAAESAFRKALQHFEACHAEMMLGHAAQGVARIMIFRGQYEEALTYATQYLKIIEAAGRESDFSLAYHTLSNIHTRLGNLDEAKSYALKAVEIARRLGYVRMIPSNLLMLGYAELALNELDSAWEHFQETITAARANSSKFDLTAATYSLGDVCMRRDDYAEALRYYQEALTLANESRIAAYRSLCSIEIAYIHMVQHEIDDARSALRQGALVALQIKSDILLAKALIPAMKLWQALGELELAAEWSGLLTLHPEHAEQKLVDAMSQQLEEEIGAKRYQGATERGKQFRLDEAVNDLIKRIDSGFWESQA
jgi:tetratricopeptide (TPR) repeat protein